MKKEISMENLDFLIATLEDCKKKGIHDPWIFSDGKEIEPLDVLIELRELKVSMLRDKNTI